MNGDQNQNKEPTAEQLENDIKKAKYSRNLFGGVGALLLVSQFAFPSLMVPDEVQKINMKDRFRNEAIQVQIDEQLRPQLKQAFDMLSNGKADDAEIGKTKVHIDRDRVENDTIERFSNTMTNDEALMNIMRLIYVFGGVAFGGIGGAAHAQVNKNEKKLKAMQPS